MPPDQLHPDIAALAAAFDTELLFGQVLIRRANAGFELRHVADRQSRPAALRLLAEGEIRPFAQFDSSGQFRPLKSAPNLSAGWRISARDERALATALNLLYPGALADWFAARSASPPSPPIASSPPGRPACIASPPSWATRPPRPWPAPAVIKIFA